MSFSIDDDTFGLRKKGKKKQSGGFDLGIGDLTNDIRMDISSFQKDVRRGRNNIRQIRRDTREIKKDMAPIGRAVKKGVRKLQLRRKFKKTPKYQVSFVIGGVLQVRRFNDFGTASMFRSRIQQNPDVESTSRVLVVR